MPASPVLLIVGLPQVLLMERMYMRREMYLSIMMDRGSQVGCFPLFFQDSFIFMRVFFFFRPVLCLTI